MRGWRRQALLGAGLLVAVWGVVLAFGLRLNGPDGPTPPGPARLWLPAVTGRETDLALELARELVPAADVTAPPAEYAELFRRLGVDPAFLTTEFGPWDVDLWRSAWETQWLATQLTAEASNDIEAIFVAVCERLDPQPGAEEPRVEPLTAWHAGTGNSAEAAWLLADLFGALGADTCLGVLLPSPDGQAVAYVAEVRIAQGIFVLDPARRLVHAGLSLPGALAHPAARHRLWPDAPETAVTHYLLPARPADFCPRNQLLAERIRRELAAETPPFGTDPATRAAELSTPDHPVGFMAAPFQLFLNRYGE